MILTLQLYSLIILIRHPKLDYKRFYETETYQTGPFNTGDSRVLMEDDDMVSWLAPYSHAPWSVCGTWEAGGFVLAKTSNKSDKLAATIIGVQRF